MADTYFGIKNCTLKDSHSSIFLLLLVLHAPLIALSQLIGAHGTDGASWGSIVELKKLFTGKTPLFVGGTQTQVLAGSIAIAGNALNHCATQTVFIYNSFVNSKSNYAVEAGGGEGGVVAATVHLTGLVVVQKQILRVIIFEPSSSLSQKLFLKKQYTKHFKFV